MLAADRQAVWLKGCRRAHVVQCGETQLIAGNVLRCELEAGHTGPHALVGTSERRTDVVADHDEGQWARGLRSAALVVCALSLFAVFFSLGSYTDPGPHTAAGYVILAVGAAAALVSG